MIDPKHTITKIDVCNPAGEVEVANVAAETCVIPKTCMVPVSVDTVDYGIIAGYAHLIKITYTKWSRLLTLLLGFILPKHEITMVRVRLKYDAGDSSYISFDFDVPFVKDSIVESVMEHKIALRVRGVDIVLTSDHDLCDNLSKAEMGVVEYESTPDFRPL